MKTFKFTALRHTRNGVFCWTDFIQRGKNTVDALTKLKGRICEIWPSVFQEIDSRTKTCIGRPHNIEWLNAHKEEILIESDLMDS